MIEKPNPKISADKCAASVKIAIDPDLYPPYNSAPMKSTETEVTKISFFIAALFDLRFFSIACLKLRGYFTFNSFLLSPKSVALPNGLSASIAGSSIEYFRTDLPS